MTALVAGPTLVVATGGVHVVPESEVVVVRPGNRYGSDDWPSVLRDVVDRRPRSTGE